MQTVRQRTVPGFRLTECVYPSGAHLPRHTHDEAVLCFVLDGSFRERVERRTLDVDADQLLVRPAGCPHANEFADGLRCMIVEVSDASSRDIPQVGEFLERPVGITRSDLRPLIANIEREAISACPTAPLALEGLLLQFLARAARSPLRGDRRPAWLDRVVEHLQDSYRQPFDLGSLAREVGVHRVHLARAFRRHVGSSVGEFVRDLRLRWVEKQLTHSDASIGSIAATAGFADQSHLARVFRQSYGVTPSQLRAARRR